jgi:hypothetical protein
MALNIDGRVLSRALVYAITLIDDLTKDRPDEVNRDRNEMVHILTLMIPDPAQREVLALEVEAVTGRLADLTDWRSVE